MSKEIGNNFVDVDYTIQKIAIVKINRPEAKNALNGEVRKQLAQIFSELSFNDEINAVVLTGGDEVFAAGADLKEMATATSTEMLLRHTERYWNAISQCPKPVIAAVNGYALGGGCELAMHADIIIAGKSAVFGQPEIKVGLMPGAGGTQRLFRAVGKFHAMRMIMTGAMVKAEEAYIIGLVSQVTEDDQTIPTAIQMAQSLAKMPPIALQQIKEVALMSEDVPLNAGLTLERKSFQLLFSTEDKNEGVQAFIEKRKPSYQGK
ncbi:MULTISPECIES: enoyl-CoA hydratase [Acinetobacter]|jgi:enoyl-CoA hydratase/carnithine racemase|uniref:enoyl-CoA hydratase n=1 Tax=Acinetobacter TaxID=469 RepID=UPI00287DE604|nr:enoyl-CoA hydratase [Acinetobacter sp. V102_4]MDS7929516.1 enoyl-CoA hydratase [Acinetobacter sp. V102_4]